MFVLLLLSVSVLSFLLGYFVIGPWFHGAKPFRWKDGSSMIEHPFGPE